MQKAQHAIAVDKTEKYRLTMSPQTGCGLRMFPCQTQVLTTQINRPMLVHIARDVVAMFPACQCAGTGYRQRTMHMVPMMGKVGYM